MNRSRSGSAKAGPYVRLFALALIAAPLGPSGGVAHVTAASGSAGLQACQRPPCSSPPHRGRRVGGPGDGLRDAHLVDAHVQQPDGQGEPVLRPTNHPRPPSELWQFWLAPAKGASPTLAMNELAAAVKLEVDGNFAKALPILSEPGVQQGTLGHYAQYYQGFAELRLGRPEDARRTFQTLASKNPVGFLVEAIALRDAEAADALGDQAAALAIYERLSKAKATAPDDVLLRLGRSARATGNTEKAIEAFSRIVYEFPFSDLAPIAGSELETLPIGPIAPGTNRYKLELGRAERLFGARRYAQARIAFDGLRQAAQGDDRELVQLRLAECDYFQKRARAAREGVRPFVEKASRQGEALFFYAVASRELGDHAEYLRVVRRLVSDFPTQSWAEEALNNLATHHILLNDDQSADGVFRELYEKFPGGRYGERAAWKLGWWAYKNGRYAETVRVFESAAAQFPRSDYRPPWLYWSGRAHEALKEPALADARYSLIAYDYLNSYYGRLALTRLEGRAPPALPDQPPAATTLPPNEPVVRALLVLDLYDQALDELRYAQRVWGDSPAIQATIGWIHRERGDLRPGINAMKRAYPQYLAAGGEKLPTDILKVLYPVNYWDLIRRYSAEHQLDPYLIAALIAQESTFTEDIKSPANAYGLMQLLPSTGRQYARMLGLTRRFSISLLTTAEPNIKMGTAYFADLVKQFGGAHYALATYNAGPNRVARWIAERPGIERDEFIDDIPFPETQNYVKRVLGTAEEYRRIYGSGALRADEIDATPAVSRRAAAAPPKPAKASASPAKKKATPAKKKPARRIKKSA
jgi:soluble lytic murein transglycosylase